MNSKAWAISRSRAKKASHILAAALSVAATLFFITAESGCADNESAASKTNTGKPSSQAEFSDVKLLADFKNQVLYSGGKQIDINDLEIEGSAHYQPDSGLAVYKGGINDVPDPSFEGDGWKLSQDAALDSVTAKTGNKSVRIESDGSSGVVAELRTPVPVASDQAFNFINGQMKQATRTVSFDSNCSLYSGGTLNLHLKVFDSKGDILGEHSYAIDVEKPGWQRTGFVYPLPEGTDSYNIEIVSTNFSGVCNIDAILSEAKDFFTPYFDGDSDNCYWVKAAAPQEFHGVLSTINKNLIMKFILIGLLATAAAVAVILLYIKGVRRHRHKLVVISLLVALPLFLVVLISTGVTPRPDFWPQRLYVHGSDLQRNRTYYYRVTSVDAQGVESTPSAEARIKTDWLKRKIILGWDKDPEAVNYRVYRGESTYSQDAMFEVDGGQQAFMDTGLKGTQQTPPREMANSGVAHASRSLRPNPDVRISSEKLQFDPGNDFWVAGEVEFGFSNILPFIPASFFEIGDPNLENQFAVSTRYATTWGDEFPKILLIKGKGFGDAESSWQPLVPIFPGSVIRYVAAVLYEPNGDLPAGTHLWYRINQDEIKHITIANSDPIQGQTLITISKRYFYDEFGNNSVARSFVIVQNKVDNKVIDTIMGPGTVPMNVGILTGSEKLSSTDIP